METLQSDIRMDSIVSSKPEEKFHPLKNIWNLWAHLPHDTDWTVNSYKSIYKLTTIEETIAISETLPEILVKNCMLFIMKEGIIPIWEDKQNRQGGCFSYKISNKNVYQVWRDLTYILVGESMSTNIGFVNNITGITISPKKNFCIIKIWMTSCDYQNPAIISQEVPYIIPHGCLFKKHAPEY
jgi:translation initiation factor 4E